MGVFEAFWRRSKLSFLPRRYHELADESLKRMLWHVPLVVLVGFIVWLVLLTPALLTFVSSVESQLTNFEEFSMDAHLKMRDPIALPASNPRFVVDLINEERITTETVRITKRYIYFNILSGPKRIPIQKVLHPLDHKEAFAQALLMLLLLALPSVLFYLYVGFLLKYAFLIGLTTALALFTIHILLVINIPPRHITNLAVYAATPMVLLETLIAPINSSILLPFFDVIGIRLYALPLGVYLGLFITGLVHMHQGHHESRWTF